MSARPLRRRSLARREGKADRVKAKADPVLIAKARELRDKWMDHVAANGGESITPLSHGKYEINRVLASTPVNPRLAA